MKQDFIYIIERHSGDYEDYMLQYTLYSTLEEAKKEFDSIEEIVKLKDLDTMEQFNKEWNMPIHYYLVEYNMITKENKSLHDKKIKLV